MKDVDLENAFIREPVKYVGRFHRVFATDIFGSYGEKKRLLASFWR